MVAGLGTGEGRAAGRGVDQDVIQQQAVEATKHIHGAGSEGTKWEMEAREGDGGGANSGEERRRDGRREKENKVINHWNCRRYNFLFEAFALPPTARKDAD